MKRPPESAGVSHLLWSTRDYKIHPFQQIRNLIIHAIEITQKQKHSKFNEISTTNLQEALTYYKRLQDTSISQNERPYNAYKQQTIKSFINYLEWSVKLMSITHKTETFEI